MINILLNSRALGGNPLFCDCKLKWLSDWIKRDFIEPGIAVCNGPLAMKSKLLLSSPSSDFECRGEKYFNINKTYNIDIKLI